MVSEEEQWDDTEHPVSPREYAPPTHATPVTAQTSNKAVIALLVSIVALPTSLLAWLFFYLPVSGVILALWALGTDINGRHMLGKKMAWTALVFSLIACVLMVLTWIGASHYETAHPY